MRRAELHIACVSHRGRRPRQEDSGLAEAIAEGAVIAVADGMGGHLGGDVASRLAVEALQHACAGPRQHPRELLAGAADEANRAILAHAAKTAPGETVGSTLVAAVVLDGQAVIGHAGDSRAWLVTADEVVQLTRDHSAVQDALDRGTMTPEEASRSVYRNAILRNLGDPAFPGLEFTPEQGWLELSPGSVLLLTSDGAHGVLTPAEFLHHLVGTPTLERGLDHLLRLAYHRGSDDNITLVGCEVGRLRRSQTPAQPPPPMPRPSSGTARRRHPAIPAAVGVLLVALVALAGLLTMSVRSSRRSPFRPVLRPAAAMTPHPSVEAPAASFATPLPVGSTTPSAKRASSKKVAPMAPAETPGPHRAAPSATGTPRAGESVAGRTPTAAPAVTSVPTQASPVSTPVAAPARTVVPPATASVPSPPATTAAPQLLTPTPVPDPSPSPTSTRPKGGTP